MDSKSSPTERLLHLWKLYLGTVGSLNAARLEMKALHETNDKENMKVKSWAWAWAWFSRRDGEECDPHHVRKQDTVMAIAKCRLM